MYTHHKVDHEYPDGAPTRVSYMVCSVPRSGSSLLCELLCNTELAGAPTEFFDPELMGRFRQRWGATSFDDYIVQLLAKKTSPNGVFGIKVHWRQLHNLLGPSDPAQLFPGLRYVHIRREDVLRQAVSWVRALQTNQWASSDEATGEPAFNRAQIEFYVERLREEEAAWEEFFVKHSVSPYRVVYEHLVVSPVEVVGSVLGFIGEHGDAEPAAVTLERQADALTDEWVERFAADQM
jgi:LPS sulfotransferase NodH